jgi:hypothetical protein
MMSFGGHGGLCHSHVLKGMYLTLKSHFLLFLGR